MDYWKHLVFPFTAVSLLLYALLWLPWFDGYRAAESVLAVLLLATVVRFWQPWFRADPLVRLWLLFLGFLILVQFWYAFSLPDGEAFAPSTKVTRHYTKPILILAVGIMALQYGRRFLLWFGAAAVTGLLIHLALQLDTSQWERALSGRRVDFNTRNAQHIALVFGTLLLASVCYLPRALTGAHSTPLRALAGITTVLLVALGAFGILVTETRGVWLGLTGGAIVAVGTLLFSARRTRSGLIIGVATVFVTASAIFGLNVDERISNRFAQADISAHLEEGYAKTTSDDIELGSAGVRIRSYLAATEWIRQRPLLGWGADNAQDLIGRSPHFSDRFKRRFGHLHNMHLEILLAHGLLGGILFYGMFIAVCRAAWRAYARTTMPADAALFGLAFTTFWVIANVFESYYLYVSGQYIATIGFGFIYAFYFHADKTRHGGVSRNSGV